MTVFRCSWSVGLMLLATAAAYGQYGLYGSPDLLQLPAAKSAPSVSTASYAAPAFQPPIARPQPQPVRPQPQPVRPQPQPAQPFTRQPLLQFGPAAPQYAVPQHAMPRYASARQAMPQYAGSHYAMPQRPVQPQAMPRYAAPVVVQPHPAAAHSYTPEVPQPAEPLQQAIPVPPSPPGMTDSSESPSDAPADTPSDAPLPAPAANGYAPANGSYLDYDPAWGDCGPTPPAYSGYEASCGGGFGCSPFAAACGIECEPSRWYAGAASLFLGRNNANRLWTTYEDGNNPNQLMHTDMIGLQWRAGGEVKLGRRFGCCGEGPWALQASYFTIEPFYGFRSMTHANGVSTTLTVRELRFNGTDARDWFDGAAEHRLWRRNELHNAELSFVRTDLPWTYGSRFDCDFEFGVRYFRFWEQLTFGTRRAGASWSQLAQTAFLDDQVANNLIGFQFGADMGYHFHPSCRVFVTPKIGIYNNYVDHRFVARLGDGTVATVTGPAGESFPVHANTNVLSFLTQIDMGLDWQLTQRFSAKVGYRVMVATGMALADHQIPHYVNDIPEYRNIKTNGELILHGAFAGLTYNY